MSAPPKKELGQHFLADENILGVIGRLAELSPGDVVLEIGPGLGVLTSYLAERVAGVHAVEIDQSLEPHLRDIGDNVSLEFGDALRVDLPSNATKLVANLPYNVATPLVVESLDALPNIELWCVMVQREVADRLFARRHEDLRYRTYSSSSSASAPGPVRSPTASSARGRTSTPRSSRSDGSRCGTTTPA